MQELIPPHKRTVELTFKIFRVRRKEKKVLKFLKKGIEYKGRRKHSSAGMSVRLTRERSRVRAPLLPLWGISAVGSALHSHCKGHGFESRILHFIKEYRKVIVFLRYSFCFYRYYTGILFSCKESANISQVKFSSPLDITPASHL